MCTNLNTGNSKAYWNLLKKLENSNNTEKYIPDQVLIDHFKDILQEENATMSTTNLSVNSDLDYEITVEELKMASNILRNGKSPGLDNILNEMIRPFVTIYPDIILKLFNKVLNNNSICHQWLISIITAIHKKGETNDPNNYRGVSVMSCIGKLFFTILNNRLTKFAKDKHLLTESQLGFIQGNRTSDAHIILHNLIQKYCHKKKGKMYGCFVDFSKAFDNISRDILLSKLQSEGIKGKFFDIIKTIYSKDMTSVKIGTSYSEPFKPNKGVRQGCVLSPLLFNIFLADLQDELDSCGDNVKVNDEKEISCLLWADDILILSESENGLQRKLDQLGVYCANNRLTVNTDKTECMIFNKTGRLMEHKFYLDYNLIKNVRKYKYLGFLVTPSGEIRSGLEDLRIRALKALMKVKHSLGPLFHQNIKNSIHLYNHMVKPILLYMSDLWGCLKLPKNNPIERLHNMFCKQLLGVQKQTPTVGILLELGLVPITFHAIKASIKNWDRIRKKRSNNLLYESLGSAIFDNLPWISSIKSILESKGMLQSFLSINNDNNNNEQKSTENQIFQRLSDEFHQNALESIENDNSKLKTYSSLKNKIGMEKYLMDITNINHRVAMTKLRLSNHPLHIETGRHVKIERNQRFCPFCPTLIEDEIHFLVQCPTYKELRDKLLTNTSHSNKNFSNRDKFLAILKQDKLNTTAKFIFEAFELRKTTMDVNNVMEYMLSKVESIR